MPTASPASKSKRRPRALSEYAHQLREKQKLKNLYNLREAQLRKTVKEAFKVRGKEDSDVSHALIKLLEQRLDNAVFRLGLAISRPQARQMVSHGHFLVNGKSSKSPGLRVKKGDVIKLKPKSAGKKIFQNIAPILKKHKTPSWLSLDVENLEAKITGEPTFEEAAPPVEIPVIFEYYSR